MKIKYQSIWPLLIVIMVSISYTSCSDDSDLLNNGEPRIRYIRITKPTSSDSLLVSAFQSNLVAIIGENLQSAQQVWFNDQQATLTPTYVSSTSILVSVPGSIPKVITNKMTIVFENGNSLSHDFEVKVSAPEITSMDAEYVNEGGVATIRGSFFYTPLTVTFTGGVVGEIVSVDDELLEVKVPAGAQPGPVTVKTNFGEVKSNFWFRDNRNLFVTIDPPPSESWMWGYDLTVNANDPLAINGNYVRLTKKIGPWSWTEMIGGGADNFPTGKNIPNDAFIRPDEYVLKFEVNTFKPYNGNMIRIMLGDLVEPWDDAYYWNPPFDSKGKWATVVIPFADIIKKRPVAVSANGYGVKIWWLGAGEVDADIAFDNFRVVPKVLKK